MVSKEIAVSFPVAVFMKKAGFSPTREDSISCYNEQGEFVGDYGFFNKFSKKAETFVPTVGVWTARSFFYENFGIFVHADLVSDYQKFIVKFALNDNIRDNYSDIEFPEYDIELFDNPRDAVQFGLNWIVNNDVIKVEEDFACDKCGLNGSKCVGCYV